MTLIERGGRAGKRGPSFKKSLTIAERDGRLIASKWPSKMPGPLSAKHKFNMDKFRQAQLMAKYAPAREQIIANEVTAGTPLLPRDLFMMAMYGRLFEIELSGGPTIYPEAWRLDIQASLDVFGVLTGALLTRLPSSWSIIPPGAAGSALTSQGPGKNLIWKTH